MKYRTKIKTFENGERYAKTDLGYIDFKLTSSNKSSYSIGEKIVILAEYDGRLLNRDEYIALTNSGEIGTIVDLINAVFHFNENGKITYDLVIDVNGEKIIRNERYYRLGWKLKNK